MAEPPFLPPTSGDRYTLILDLDETLVHYVDEGENKGKYTARPFSKDFLYQMSKFFEVVVFTAGL